MGILCTSMYLHRGCFTTYILRDTTIPLVRSKRFPPRTNGLTRLPAVVTAKERTLKNSTLVV